MSETLETAVRLHGQLAGQLKGTGVNILLDLAPRAELEVFHGHSLGDGEAVMDLGHAYLFPRILYASLLVGGNASTISFLNVGIVVAWEHSTRGRAGADLQRFHVNGLVLE